MKATVRPVYLGDSVYCTSDGATIHIFLDNGYGATSSIIFESTTLAEFLEFLKAIEAIPDAPK
jgi:hypothetical protein